MAKAAAQLDETVFESIHEALMGAYFEGNRDISSEKTLKSIWQDVGIELDQFPAGQDPKFLKSVIAEHYALACGAQGTPSFRTSHHDVAITGLHTVEVLERRINRVLDDKV